MSSPHFSSFRELMDKWDRASRVFLENDLCLFFKKDGALYGTTETGRITFARMKNPDSKEDKSWRKEASFSAYDLEKSSEGKNSMSVFSFKDLGDLKVITQADAEKFLEDKGKKLPNISDDDREQGQTYGEK